MKTVIITGGSRGIGFSIVKELIIKKKYLVINISKDKNIIGYKIYWRKTTSPFWENSRLVGKVNNYKLNGIVIDNYLFGVSSISEKGYESVVVFPNDIF